MPKNISQRSFFNFVQIFVLICSFILPHWAVGSVSDLRLKTLIKICEAAQSTGDGGTITNIALQLKAAQFDIETDLGKQAVKCIEAGFPSDEKSASFEGMIVKINPEIITVVLIFKTFSLKKIILPRYMKSGVVKLIAIA